MPLHVKAAVIGALRAVRTAHSAVWGAIVAAFPAIEPAFIRAGRGPLARWELGRQAYWFAQDDLLQRLRRSGRRFRRIDIGGNAIYADVTGPTGRLHYFYGQPYEPGLTRALADTLRAGDVFVDVGANVGFFSIVGASLVGSTGRVIAFEPHPQALEVFRAAIAINQLAARIEVVEAAVGSGGTPTIPLHVTIDSSLSSTDPRRAPLAADYAFSSAIDVPYVTIDGWMQSHPDVTPRIAAIKIDVEGTELDVLHGMADTIGRAPNAAIFCETSAGSPADGWLRERGYHGSPLELWNGAFGNYRYVR